MTPRFLATEGVHNFRDYGGWTGAGGRTVRRGLLYRSGQHVAASDADLAEIAALDIRTVIDLRGTSERARHPCRRVPGFAGEVVFYEGETSSSPPHMDVDPATSTEAFARARMLAVYGRIPTNPAACAMLARYLGVLGEREGASLVHCFAGKDRTGIAVTLLLHILGVSEADQMTEYLRTNDAPTLSVLRAQSVPGIEARLGRKLDEAGVQALLEVRPDYLTRFREAAARLEGSLDAWLARRLGVDEALRERLRTRFLA
ncbi:tyrosine-protein phosphatase [Qipengyuania sediminis]|uniref:tyrosine-protein phosphatase n=1 Tax=Qipengyuania sediminis TaxID=1532023 RepID=UPI00105A15C0|nr:tyrosine-protein phosphatase [Qipengyuania sediminis]